MGAGVQGLAEAPWLDLSTPAATNGWWARTGALPAVSVHDTDPARASQVGTDPGRPGTGEWWRQGAGNGHGTGTFRDMRNEDADSHTLVVDREDGGRYPGGREFFLQRWLFSPRLLVVALIVALGAGLGFGGWWLTTGRFVQVPSVAGFSVAEATTALTGEGFKVRQGGRVHSNSVDRGLVASTSPSGRVSKGATITILISSGPFTSTVPKVRGDTPSEARAALKRVHLTATVQRVGSNAPVGSVVGTNPPAGTTWPQTKTVAILVAAGPPLPNFVGMNIGTAEQWAGQHNVNLQEQQDTNSQQPQGTITGQQPAAGSTYQPGQTVTVNVSAGPQLVPVPSPIGLSVEQATALLQGQGFHVQVNRYGPFDKVFNFSPVGEAPRGSTITLDVGY
jgi:serine/threonine-protein kinase